MQANYVASLTTATSKYIDKGIIDYLACRSASASAAAACGCCPFWPTASDAPVEGRPDSWKKDDVNILPFDRAGPFQLVRTKLR